MGLEEETEEEGGYDAEEGSGCCVVSGKDVAPFLGLPFPLIPGVPFLFFRGFGSVFGTFTLSLSSGKGASGWSKEDPLEPLGRPRFTEEIEEGAEREETEDWEAWGPTDPISSFKCWTLERFSPNFINTNFEGYQGRLGQQN